MSKAELNEWDEIFAARVLRGNSYQVQMDAAEVGL